MPTPLVGAALVVGAYLVGSTSLAIALASHRGVDLRALGSGNPGATNVGRALGPREGRLVLLVDALKGAVPVLVAHAVIGGDSGWAPAAGAAAVVGHCWPVWHGFRGGKGAATGVGVLAALSPIAGGAAFGTYVVLRRATRRASVGSLGGAVAGACAATASGAPASVASVAWGLAVLVWSRHAENLARLARGMEPPG